MALNDDISLKPAPVRGMAIIRATISAITVFIVCDAVVEQLISRLFGVSLLDLLREQTGCAPDMRFHVINFILFSAMDDG